MLLLASLLGCSGISAEDFPVAYAEARCDREVACGETDAEDRDACVESNTYAPGWCDNGTYDPKLAADCVADWPENPCDEPGPDSCVATCSE